jgi:hypothetical protein
MKGCTMTQEPPTRKAVVSTLELARLSYPNGTVTSGAGQAYLARLDRAFQPGRFVAHVQESWDGSSYVMSPDESQVIRVPAAVLPQVVRRWLD